MGKAMDDNLIANKFSSSWFNKKRRETEAAVTWNIPLRVKNFCWNSSSVVLSWWGYQFVVAALFLFLPSWHDEQCCKMIIFRHVYSISLRTLLQSAEKLVMIFALIPVGGETGAVAFGSTGDIISIYLQCSPWAAVITSKSKAISRRATRHFEIFWNFRVDVEQCSSSESEYS